MRWVVAAATVILAIEALLAGMAGNISASIGWASAASATGIFGGVAVMQTRLAERVLARHEATLQVTEAITAQLKAIPPELLAGGYVKIEDRDGVQVIRFPVSLN